MGEVLMQPMGGGVESDDVTAAKAQVLIGYKTVTKDSHDEVVAGTMPNNAAWSASTSGSGSVTIPAGYHNGSGTVSGSASYSQGVSDADGRVNTSSASYNQGYANGKNDTGFNLAANVTIYSWGGTREYPGTGDKSYTFTATQTTWWAADGYIGRSDTTSRISGQGSGVLLAGQSHTITAHTSTTVAHDCAIIHFAAWVRAQTYRHERLVFPVRLKDTEPEELVTLT